MTVWPAPIDDVDYPTTDGEPMGETDIHRDLMIDLIEALKHHYHDDSQTYVSGNIMIYYEQGNAGAHLSPDVLVTPGVSKAPMETYKLWEVGKAPELVVEVTSRSTKMRDIGVKKGLYEALGVTEYLLFDPRSEYLQPRFQVFRLEGEFYVPHLVPETVGYASRLGLTFRVVDGTLRVLETSTETLLPRPSDLRALAVAQQERADAEEERADRLARQLRLLGVEPEA